MRQLQIRHRRRKSRSRESRSGRTATPCMNPGQTRAASHARATFQRSGAKARRSHGEVTTRPAAPGRYACRKIQNDLPSQAVAIKKRRQLFPCPPPPSPSPKPPADLPVAPHRKRYPPAPPRSGHAPANPSPLLKTPPPPASSSHGDTARNIRQTRAPSAPSLFALLCLHRPEEKPCAIRRQMHPFPQRLQSPHRPFPCREVDAIPAKSKAAHNAHTIRPLPPPSRGRASLQALLPC